MADNGEDNLPLKRATTMEVTAEEGHQLLKEGGSSVDEKADHLRSGQTFKKAGDEETEENETSRIKKTLTMTETVKEAEGILGEKELGRTRGQDQASGQEETDGDESTPSLTKTSTMVETVKESSAIVESLGDAATAGTRGEAKQLEDALKKSEDDDEEHPNGEKDAATLKRKGTMIATAEEGEEFLKRQKLSEANGDESAAKEVEA